MQDNQLGPSGVHCREVPLYTRLCAIITNDEEVKSNSLQKLKTKERRCFSLLSLCDCGGTERHSL